VESMVPFFEPRVMGQSINPPQHTYTYFTGIALLHGPAARPNPKSLVEAGFGVFFRISKDVTSGDADFGGFFRIQGIPQTEAWCGRRTVDGCVHSDNGKFHTAFVSWKKRLCGGLVGV